MTQEAELAGNLIGTTITAECKWVGGTRWEWEIVSTIKVFGNIGTNTDNGPVSRYGSLEARNRMAYGRANTETDARTAMMRELAAICERRLGPKS